MIFPVRSSMESEPTSTTLGETILLIDDEIALLDVNRRGLTALGYHVLTAPGGEQGLHLLDKHSVDLVILDMLMPGMDGVETLHRIRQRIPDQKVVILSAFAESEKISAVTELGILAYLKKPLPLKTMAATLRKAMHGDPDAEGETN